MKKGMIPHNLPFLDDADAKAVGEAVKSGWVAEGSLSRKFEAEVSRYLKRRFAKVTSSGTSALHLALLALNLQKGDEIIFSTYACTALLNAVYYVGAKPVLVDIDENYLGPSSAGIQKKLTLRTKAIIIHHAFGIPSEIMRVKSFGVPVIEDCAQSLGTEIQGRPAGSFGDITICSFYATKMMTAGYGGMVLSDQKKYHDRILDLTLFDQRKDYKVRYNYYLSDVSAALGLSQFKKLPSFVKRRQEIAARYLKVLYSSPFYYWEGKKEDKPNYYRFLVGCLKPYSELIRKFAKHKIEVISPIEPYQLLHRYLGQSSKDYPVAEAIARTVVSLPVYPALSNFDINKICTVLKQIRL